MSDMTYRLHLLQQVKDGQLTPQEAIIEQLEHDGAICLSNQEDIALVQDPETVVALEPSSDGRILIMRGNELYQRIGRKTYRVK